MRTIDKAYRHNYYDTHNDRRFVDLIDQFYTPDADFENPKVQVKGREQLIEFFEQANEFVRITLVPHAIVSEAGVTATELDCIMHAQQDMPEFLLGPMKKDEEATMRMAAVYHMDGDQISRARIYWGQKI